MMSFNSWISLALEPNLPLCTRGVFAYVVASVCAKTLVASNPKAARLNERLMLAPVNSLRHRAQAPFVLQPALHRLKNQAIDDVADGNNQDHDGDHLAHVVQVASHHE